ncbi:MAG: hypothetical protein KGZ63_10810 [Clostridiales bacterium]|jgi:hypothetical protein|nr:hypothetical protein [Clostridiales bacterium]
MANVTTIEKTGKLFFTQASYSLLHYSMENVNRIAGAVPLERLDLVVGFSQSAEEVGLPVKRMLRVFMFSAIVLTLCMLFLGLLLSRLITVADAYEAMTADRPYRKAMTPAAAIRCLEEAAGIQFDKSAVDALREMTKQSRYFTQFVDSGEVSMYGLGHETGA